MSYEEDRFNEHIRLVEGLEVVFREHFRGKGYLIIDRQPPRELMMSLSEIQRGKKSKEQYLNDLYQTIVSHYGRI